MLEQQLSLNADMTQKDPIPTAKWLIAKLRRRRPVHFLHVRKTGGTAIKAALANAKSERYSIRLHRHRVRLVDIPQGETVFFFLRDPIERFLSGFYSRQRQGRPRMYSPWSDAERAAFERFHTANELGAALSAPDAILKGAALEAMKGIKHVNSHYSDWFQGHEYLLSRREDILLIGRQETLARDFATLRKLLAIPESLELPGDDIRAHRNPTNVNRTLQPEALASLRDWYQEDYDFLSFCESVGFIEEK